MSLEKMLPQLQKYEPSETEREDPCWNLGWIEIDQNNARSILGEPHYVEKDSYATAGGTEDHWTFKPEELPVVFFRLRVPYSNMDVHVAASEIPDGIWDLFTSLFPGCVQHQLDRPFDEMRHPDDPAFYYVRRVQDPRQEQ